MTNKLLSLVALAVTTVPCVLFFYSMVDHVTMKWLALAGTVLWFIFTPMWMGRAPKAETANGDS
jgi:ACR3 family arsenite efflux pump ArsB